MSQATEVTEGVGAKGQADWLEVLRAGGVGYSFYLFLFKMAFPTVNR